VIGPGWLPSRPRPLAKRLARYAPTFRRGRRRAPQTVPVMPGGELPADVAAGEPPLPTTGLFAERKAKLPVATLLPRRTDGRPAVLTGAVQRWCELRWMWVKPRFIPLLVAFMGLVGVLNARRYLLQLARGPSPVENGQLDGASAAPDLPRAIHEIQIH
jgi:hypothetical protein